MIENKDEKGEYLDLYYVALKYYESEGFVI